MVRIGLGWAGIAALLLALLGCDDDEDGGSTTSSTSSTSGTSGGGAGGGDGGTGGDGAAGASGGSGGSGGAAGAGGEGGAVQCDRTGIAVNHEGALAWSPFTDVLLYGSSSEPNSSGDQLAVELWFKYGAASTPHSFTFTGENYSTCHTCVLLKTGCQNLVCTQYFLAQSGTLNVTTLDANNDLIAGTVTDLVAIEVTFGQGQVTSPVPGGETWCVPNQAFQASYIAGPGGSPTKP